MAHLDGGEWLILLGTAGFTLALFPQLVRTLRLGRAEDLSVPFVLLVIAASAVTLAYWLVHDQPPRVWLGFVANIVVWSVVLWYRLFPRPGAVAHAPPGTPPDEAAPETSVK